MNINSLNNERQQLIDELTEFYKYNSLKYKIINFLKTNCIVKTFINLFIPYYDKQICNYTIVTHIVCYFIYCIFNLFMTACFIKLGYDFNLLLPFTLITFIIQMIVNIKIFSWQAIITNICVYIFAFYSVSRNVMYAINDGNYHKIEKVETNNINNFVKYNLLKNI